VHPTVSFRSSSDSRMVISRARVSRTWDWTVASSQSIAMASQSLGVQDDATTLRREYAFLGGLLAQPISTGSSY